jgi:hypothetical protein
MIDEPAYNVDHLVRGLSLARRAGQALAGLGGLSMAVIVGLLWTTEPGTLPARTQLGFAAIIIIGLAWAGFAAWALIRRPLFAADRVIAAGLAVAFSASTTIATVAIALARSNLAGAVVAGCLGAVLLTAAGTLLVRARAYRATLRAHERQLTQGGSPE